MSKLPSLQFYPGDWRKDVGVQSLTFHDRGVWFEMLMLMHESERRGFLLLGGSPMPEDALARILGLDKQNLTTTLTTLLSSGVASKDAEVGALICRRMVRDENLRQIRAQAGKKGGNPALLKQNPTTRDKQKPTTRDKQKPTPSSSFSSSDKRRAMPPFTLPEWVPVDLWNDFEAMREQGKKHPYTEGARKEALRKLTVLRSEGHDPVACLRKSILHGYPGIYPPDQDITQPRSTPQAIKFSQPEAL